MKFGTVSQGSKDATVKKLQQLLEKRTGKRPSGGQDGIFGPGTRALVMEFQGMHGLTTDGICGKNTWYALEPTLYKGDSGQIIALVQDKLRERLQPVGKSDGVFGVNTEKAVKGVQAAADLVQDGIIGVNTWPAIKGARQEATAPRTSHFRMAEFNCKDGVQVPKEYWENLQRLMNILETLRAALGERPIIIHSGYRHGTYNKKVGGASNSQHLYAAAADITVTGLSPNAVYKKADALLTNHGVGKYNTFTHVDVRGKRARW
ncbi:peptidoglycan-binding protein [Eubacteriales bacterium OttesenSCG-928-M02]|nr:peptidoglycan-binding protein [Eubacteriales bacterium OttesenSCG-928-M02]